MRVFKGFPEPTQVLSYLKISEHGAQRKELKPGPVRAFYVVRRITHLDLKGMARRC
jgi:hypothetical protein